MHWRSKAQQDAHIWDWCAQAYERRPVGGHPDIARYQQFENDLLDRVFYTAIMLRRRSLTIVDLGCGSGRHHLRCGAKVTRADAVPAEDRAALMRTQMTGYGFQYDELLDRHLHAVIGVDFSAGMLQLAKRKLREAGGLDAAVGKRLLLEQGLAQEFTPTAEVDYPVVICTTNTIGITQGAEGTKALLRRIRDLIEPHGGIGVVSALRQEMINPYALCSYESTMNVSGQPRWMVTENGRVYGSHYYIQPTRYKLALFNDVHMDARIYDREESLVEERVRFRRLPEQVRHTQETGQIHTYADYQSKWYHKDEVCAMCDEVWGGGCRWVAGVELDRLRGEMGQIVFMGDLAVADAVCRNPRSRLAL